MKRGVFMIGVFAAALIGFGADAYAADGKTVAAAQLRSGPGEQFPGVTRLAKGLRVDIHGCLSDGAWCDVSWRGRRGWVPSAVVMTGEDMPVTRLGPKVSQPQTVPEVTFELNSYWDSNYAQESWYAERTRWNAGSVQLDAPPEQLAQQ